MEGREAPDHLAGVGAAMDGREAPSYPLNRR